MTDNRRNFLRQLTAISSGSLLFQLPLDALATTAAEPGTSEESFTISILQTTDVHCQVHPHDELFWENEKVVFRKTGGYAQIATCLNNYKKQHPDTFIIDTGDMFQG